MAKRKTFKDIIAGLRVTESTSLEEAEKRYERRLQTFLKRRSGRPLQRTAGWLEMKSVSVGGSEVASLMEMNPYSSFVKVVGLKSGALSWDGGAAVACWWGTMFEPVIEDIVEIDCGTRLHGTQINITANAKSGLRNSHANSPDGYAVITLYYDKASEAWRLHTSDVEESAKNCPKKKVIALLEFKCPYRRRPRDEVPRQYRPQVWSGLALSPVAHLGLFVDAVFRKCALWDLGPFKEYDRGYHVERTNPNWTTPVAWGMIGIYAPRLDAEKSGPAKACGSTADLQNVEMGAAYEGWLLYMKELGISYESPEQSKKENRPFCPDPLDFGDCRKETFETMLGLLNRGEFLAKRTRPCFANGSGASLRTSKEIGAEVDRLAQSPPQGFYLLGVIPWKLLEVAYHFQKRRPNFLREISPLVHKCLADARSISLSDNPEKAYYEYVAKSNPSKRKKDREPLGKKIVQDFFDML
jgi:hypothetical protein